MRIPGTSFEFHCENLLLILTLYICTVAAIMLIFQLLCFKCAESFSFEFAGKYLVKNENLY